ncbi:MAG: 1-acyl-sn-glycerol-3-phosphate acyltransferase [Oscillospiraceae bacterium]|nr:1-acyl-sn-glycerol-3-phosphate acyltransferase [Oscillospiraceae bacterium]
MKSDSFYRRWYRVARFFVGIFYRLDIHGEENIPDGAAMVCANHSSRADPFLLAFAFGVKRQMRFIAKASLFKVPVLSGILKKMGMISVDRSTTDVSTIKHALLALKSGEKVAIFPEGKRVSETSENVMAKTGAVKIAERAGVPVVPVFIPRRKPLFHKIPVIIGEPYHIEKQVEKRTAEDYRELADALMDKIDKLNSGANV